MKIRGPRGCVVKTRTLEINLATASINAVLVCDNRHDIVYGRCGHRFIQRNHHFFTALLINIALFPTFHVTRTVVL